MKFILLSKLSLTALIATSTLIAIAFFESASLANTRQPTITQSEAPLEAIAFETIYPQSAYFLEQVIAAKQSERKWRSIVRQAPENAEAYQELAGALSSLARPQDAEAFYQKAIEIEPTTESLYLAYGEFLLLQRRQSEATALYQKMIEVIPDSATAYLQLALTLDINTSKPFPEAARAEAAYRAALRLDSNRIFAYQMLGEHLKRQGRLAEAKAIFETALQLNPEDYTFYENLVEIAEERGDLPTAEAIYQTAIDANPRNLDTHVRFSKWLFEHDRISAVSDSYQEALEQFPEEEGLYDKFAFYLLYAGQIEEAVVLLNQAIERGIEKPFVYLHLGRVFSEKGQQAEAEAAFRKAVLLSPDAYYELVTFLADSGRTEDAIAVCRKAIAEVKQNEFLYYKLGELYLKNQQVEKAVDTYRELFRVYSTGDHAMYLAEALLEQGQYAEAEAIYRQFVGSYDSSSRNVQRWKRALVALGREAEADSLEPYLNARLAANLTATYQEAIRISPESGYYHYLLGESLANQKQIAAAEAAYREALRLRYSAFLTTIRIGKTLFDQGLTERAENTYTAAFALEPKSEDGFAIVGLSELYQNMGELRQAQGDLYSALNFYSRAKQIDPYTDAPIEKVRELESLIDKSRL